MSQIVVNGNNLELLKNYPDNYFDAVVTDPPYGLGKEPDAVEVMRSWIEAGYHEVKGSGFMGKEWDAFVPQPIFWKEVFRVLKHGGHVLAFYGTRTYDWGVMAMRFAGFEVRDTIYWHYGSGFPKSHNIGKAIDKLHGAEREVIGAKIRLGDKKAYKYKETEDYVTMGKQYSQRMETAPATDQAKQWDGWGSALKPASEPIVLARKPLEKGLSIAENVLKWGTGGINIDGCRVGISRPQTNTNEDKFNKWKEQDGVSRQNSNNPDLDTNKGRFPANLVMSHHPECECKGLKKVGSGKEGGNNYEGNTYVVEGFVPKNSPKANSNYGEETIEDWTCHEDCPIRIMDEQSGISKSNPRTTCDRRTNSTHEYGFKSDAYSPHNDSGGASRFFYCAKASKSERNKGLDGFEEKKGSTNHNSSGRDIGRKQFCQICDKRQGACKCEQPNFSNENPNKRANSHPTVKPVKLMQYLVRLVTPPNGVVLDPFCGSGTTGIACKLEGFQFVGMEQDAEYCKIAEARIMNWVEDAEEEVNAVEAKSEEPKDSKFTQTTLF